jgi:hypothetical protein
MSVMKTFTVRDLNRSSAKVLATAKREGGVRVCGRNGDSFTVRHEGRAGQTAPDWKQFVAEHRAWHKRVFPRPSAWTKEQVAELDRMIASDGRLL